MALGGQEELVATLGFSRQGVHGFSSSKLDVLFFPLSHRVHLALPDGTHL